MAINDASLDIDQTSPTYMLTTVDNPFDPFDDWNSWLNYDLSHGYNCCALVARLSLANDSLTERENALLDNFAIDEIIASDVSDVFTRIAYPN